MTKDQQIRRLEARVAALVEVLRPFARINDILRSIPGCTDEEVFIWRQSSNIPNEQVGISYLDIRRASAALSICEKKS